MYILPYQLLKSECIEIYEGTILKLGKQKIKLLKINLPKNEKKENKKRKNYKMKNFYTKE